MPYRKWTDADEKQHQSVVYHDEELRLLRRVEFCVKDWELGRTANKALDAALRALGEHRRKQGEK